MISRELYSEMLSSLAVPCVDNIAFRTINGEPEVLLLKRKENPAKDCLYPIGRSYEKNTFGSVRALRAVRYETGLNARIVKPIGFYDKMYAVGQNENVKGGLHNPCLAFLTEILSHREPDLDATSSAYKWVRKQDFLGNLDSDREHLTICPEQRVPEVLPLPPYTMRLLFDSEIFHKSLGDLRHHDGRIVYRNLDYRMYGSDFSQFAVKD